ncbi:chemotaxis protein CheW [Thalassotalea sp. G2M2-11]|uniref:chemotaxis protein CheW n=1 Tax=Thalassotalea sp. G2M2-11 TaxID=2787627 RepID=UPI001F497A83|nr:chemotaxis protein CheW [Thalassotalea sp. G2M2-11]
MSKSLAASKKLMQNYLAELLTEESDEQAAAKVELANKQKLDNLLQQASVLNEVDDSKLDVITSVKSENKTHDKIVEKPPEPSEKVKVKDELVQDTSEIMTQKSQAEFVVKAEKDYRKGSFQAMFFDVAGLTIAVPLIELGGIHNVDKTTPLMGKPEWFKGVMLHREEKINVVDTALWVMPEKCNESLLNALEYQYIIMLNNSQWGLMAENLIDTVTLEQDEVKWLEGSGKRPWLAGLVKERMCALLDVESLIHMLEEGANIHR